MPFGHRRLDADDLPVESPFQRAGQPARQARQVPRAVVPVPVVLELVERHGGEIPQDPKAFSALPGVGAYTVAAVMSIAFDLDLAAVDGLRSQVLMRMQAMLAPEEKIERAVIYFL